ncbi:MAG TPA: helix-turn-helix domain-containing protein [Aldersonia sp.]
MRRTTTEDVGRALPHFDGARAATMTTYQAAAALDEHGLDGLVPEKPGPRRRHKLTDEVCAFAEERLGADGVLRAADLVEPIAQRFGVRVHPTPEAAGDCPRAAPRSGSTNRILNSDNPCAAATAAGATGGPASTATTRHHPFTSAQRCAIAEATIIPQLPDRLSQLPDE